MNATLTVLFSIVLSNVMLAGVIAVAAVLITRRFKFSNLAHFLWLLVLIKLVTPPLFVFELPGASVSPAERIVMRPVATPTFSLDKDGETPVDRTAENLNPADNGSTLPPGLYRAILTGNGQAADNGFSVQKCWPWIVALAWMIGAIVCMMIGFYRHRKFVLLLANAKAAGSHLKQTGAEVCRQSGLCRTPDILVVDGQIGPAAYGFFKQFVILPNWLLEEFSKEQIRLVIGHEIAHLRGGDHFIRWFQLLVLAIYWWNPIAWWATHNLRRAEEERCDSSVVARYPNSRREYGKAILRAHEVLTEFEVDPPLATAGISDSHVLRRIELIVNKRQQRKSKLSTRVLIAAVGIVVLTLGIAHPSITSANTDAPIIIEYRVGQSSNKLLYSCVVLSHQLELTEYEPGLLRGLPTRTGVARHSRTLVSHLVSDDAFSSQP